MLRSTVAIAATALSLVAWMPSLAAQPAAGQPSQRGHELYRDGNFREAYDLLRQFVLTADARDAQAADAFGAAVACLQRLNRTSEIDAFREQAVATHAEDWRLLVAVAQSYLNVEHYGALVAGQFERGQHRGQAKIVHATARDRVRATQLFVQAIRAAEAANAKTQAAPLIFRPLAATLAHGYDVGQAWRLESLTNLDELPDYEDGWGEYSTGPQGAPVDEAGNPLFHAVPPSWDAAASDGERWRWALGQWAAWQPADWSEATLDRAQFLRGQFDVQTLADFRILPLRGAAAGSDDAAAGIWAVDSLGENETISRLATGIRRFPLPEDQNFIKLYQQVLAATPRATSAARAQAAQALATLFEDRRQYPRAAHYWRERIELATNLADRTWVQERLQQIVGNWGQFEGVMTHPAGRGATVEFRFRNARQVEFVARRIDVAKLLADVKAVLKSNPKQLDWRELNVTDVGYRLVEENQQHYVDEEVARWNLTLEPRDKHFDKRITVTTPLERAGAYLVTANVEGGNQCHVVLWVADTAIVRKPMPEQAFYFVADAATGQPIAQANVEFFGFRQRPQDGKRFQVDVQNFAENSDADGQVLLPIDDEKQSGYQWLVTATTPNGRLAYLGFHSVWRAGGYDEQYQHTKSFVITDRPVYRPGQTVEFKAWVRRAQYDQDDAPQFAHQSFSIEIRNPQGEKVYSATLTSDNYGGLADKLELPSDASLGVYRLEIVNHGGGTFRVEEYKKPEFEVTVEAPKDPVMLGETITATIQAKYYFGAPVTTATVKYRVLRTPHESRWFPPAPWDWLYGPGYWWFVYDYDWYPGWRDWGCLRPGPWWWLPPPPPPEIVAERQLPIGPDGTVEVEIDTSPAKAIHPDEDQRYQIQAEVVDQSRRTIVGSGEVLVARQPFQVFTWVDRGYYRVGDTIAASFAARRLHGHGVEGTGQLKLLKISYGQGDQRVPIETEVRTWELPTDAEGRAELPIKASEKGQYRLSYSVTDQAGHTIEGGYLLTIIGEGFDGSEFRFNDLEIIPDKREYAPGDQVQLQVNTNRVGSAVLLFVRPANGAYLPPRLLRMTGKSMVVPIDVTAKDMPNFFVEAVTVSDARVHTETREIHVPPAKRVLNVDVMPSAVAYQPGQHAKIKLKVTDDAGQPFVGSTVLSIFDKSVEYISGGSNVADIKAFFWKWRREHRPHLETNLGRWSGNLVPPDETAMQSIGVFGDTVADVDLVISQTAAVDVFGDRAVMRRFRAGAVALEEWNMPAPMSALAGAEELAKGGRDGEQRSPPLVEPTIRSEFADTALWVAALDTNSDGLAEVECDMPQNLTTWKIRVWAMGHGTRVGEAATEVVTRKNVIVRMQAPRFFIERDEVVLSANVHNYLSDAKRVQVRLEQEGDTLELPGTVEQTVAIPAGGDERVDWRVKVRRDGEAVLRMAALTDVESDAVEMRFPVYVHGMLMMDSFSGALGPADQRGAFEVVVPSARRPDQTRLEVRYSPTLAGAMVDALPYLVGYPYGCTEQTLNRFLPAVITQKTLIRLDLDLRTIQEKRTNLNAQELGDAAERAKGWQRFEPNPVFDDAELTRIVKAGVQRLTEMQLSDGGWGWFSGWGEQSMPHTTAIVVHGLQIARQNDVALVPGVLERGVAWLQQYQQLQIAALANVDAAGQVIDQAKHVKYAADNLDALVYMVLVDADVHSDAMREYLYRDRTKLAVYGLALYGLALHAEQQADKLAMVTRNIGQYVVEDDENQTAYLNLAEGSWWYWYGSEFEAHAYFLKLLAATDPQNPVAARLVKYLINNRKHASYWNSTRDTALVIEALADYLKASGEDRPDMTVEVWLDGRKRQEVKIDAENLFTFDNRLVVTGDALETGRHTVELRKRGSGPLYYNGYLTNFTLEDDVRAAGLELKVERRYYKLTPAEKTVDVAGGRGQVVGQRVEKFDRAEIPNLGTVASGDLVEIELVIESKNDYEYIVFEDMKAAGCEPVALVSGYDGNELGAYMELRDNRVTLFVRQLPRGRHSVSYRMRAEIPGKFSALPTRAAAMYAPELRGNSDELKLRIEERSEEQVRDAEQS